MLRKLAIRNAKRSIKDYLVYLITVIMSFSLIIAFNLIVYSKDVRELSSMMMNFRLAVIEVSVIVVFVIGWLINYTMKYDTWYRAKRHNKNVFNRKYLSRHICVCSFDIYRLYFERFIDSSNNEYI